jgi:deferrochelatase/peroxidase EfeB
MRASMRDDATLNRRSFIAGAGAAIAATSALACGSGRKDNAQATGSTRDSDAGSAGQREGIASRPHGYLQLTAFDLQRDSTLELRELLRRWSALATDMTVRSRTVGRGKGAGSTGLTITFGLGPALFAQHRRDRLGLAGQRPPALRPLPAFRGDAIEPTYSDGDLCIQVCARDLQAAFDAGHTLTRAATGYATPRWAQTGFLPQTAGTPRNLMGFKDGTNNIDPDDRHALDEHVWVGADDDAPAWMHGGTYMIVRRIHMLLDVWDATSLQEQEATIGRHKASGAPLAARAEHDPVDLDGTAPDGALVIPSDAHVRLAAASNNGGARILRRGYNYADDIEPATGQRDEGLIFISYQRDPRQFIRLQRRLAGHDALTKHILHIGSAIFACPPAARPGGFVGDALLE